MSKKKTQIPKTTRAMLIFSCRGIPIVGSRIQMEQKKLRSAQRSAGQTHAWNRRQGTGGQERTLGESGRNREGIGKEPGRNREETGKETGRKREGNEKRRRLTLTSLRQAKVESGENASPRGPTGRRTRPVTSQRAAQSGNRACNRNAHNAEMERKGTGSCAGAG